MHLDGFRWVYLDLRVFGGISMIYGLRGQAACGNLWREKTESLSGSGSLWQPVA